jgi:hypothetical protein
VAACRSHSDIMSTTHKRERESKARWCMLPGLNSLSHPRVTKRRSNTQTTSTNTPLQILSKNTPTTITKYHFQAQQQKLKPQSIPQSTIPFFHTTNTTKTTPHTYIYTSRAKTKIIEAPHYLRLQSSDLIFIYI